MEISPWFSRTRFSSFLRTLTAATFIFTAAAIALFAITVPIAGGNVRITNDNDTTYLSADQLAGGTYTDAVLLRCGTDRRQQNEPTLAIDPRNPTIWVSGANDYCTIPTVTDSWAGFYRSTD